MTFHWAYITSHADPKDFNRTDKNKTENSRDSSSKHTKSPHPNLSVLITILIWFSNWAGIILRLRLCPHPPIKSLMGGRGDRQWYYLDGCRQDIYWRHPFLEGWGWGYRWQCQRASPLVDVTDWVTLPVWAQSHQWWQNCRMLLGGQDSEVSSVGGSML